MERICAEAMDLLLQRFTAAICNQSKMSRLHLVSLWRSCVEIRIDMFITVRMNSDTHAVGILM